MQYEFNVTDELGRAHFVRATDEMDARMKVALAERMDATKMRATRVTGFVEKLAEAAHK